MAVSQPAPRTTFDVDLHRAKATDTYASICREYYNDAKYEIALKQFNGGRALATDGSIDIPPIHVLRKMFPGSIGQTTGRSSTGSAPEWVAPPAPTTTTPRQPEFRPGRSQSYTVPAGGATLKDIARWVLGSDQRWKDIWDANPDLTRADETLPAGRVIKLPSDARYPE